MSVSIPDNIIVGPKLPETDCITVLDLNRRVFKAYCANTFRKCTRPALHKQCNRTDMMAIMNLSAASFVC